MNSKELLAIHNLKRTSCREGIIDVILKSNGALSENEIRGKLQGSYDRTTFYRSFKILVDHKILHKIVVDSQLVKYALGRSFEKTEHAHFYCKECDSVQCVYTIPVSSHNLPSGFSATETEVIIKGTCNLCKNSQDKS